MTSTRAEIITCSSYIIKYRTKVSFVRHSLTCLGYYNNTMSKLFFCATICLAIANGVAPHPSASAPLSRITRNVVSDLLGCDFQMLFAVSRYCQDYTITGFADLVNQDHVLVLGETTGSLVSQRIQPNGPLCLKVKYYAYSRTSSKQDVPVLSVRFDANNGGNTIFTTNDKSHDGHKMAYITLARHDLAVQYTITMNKEGDKTASTMAIGTIVAEVGQCAKDGIVEVDPNPDPKPGDTVTRPPIEWTKPSEGNNVGGWIGGIIAVIFVVALVGAGYMYRHKLGFQ